MGRLAHLYPEYHPKQDAPVAAGTAPCALLWGVPPLPTPAPSLHQPLPATLSCPSYNTQGRWRGKRRPAQQVTPSQRTANRKVKSPSPSRPIFLTLPLGSSRQPRRWFSSLYSASLWVWGKLKISDAFQKAQCMPPSCFRSYTFSLWFIRRPPQGVEITGWPLLFEDRHGYFYSASTF